MIDMKRFILMIITLLPISAMAQIPEISKLADSYAQTDGITVVNLTSEMLKMANVDEAAMGVDLESLIIITAENGKRAKVLKKQAAKIIAKLKLNSLCGFEYEGAVVELFMTDSTAQPADVVISISGEFEEAALIDVTGNFTEAQIAQLIENFGGM
jgi:hypothetical protein